MGRGAILQLAAIGSQNTILTGDPDITFFKAVYRKHTNFSMEVVEHSFNNELSNDVNILESTIHRKGF